MASCSQTTATSLPSGSDAGNSATKDEDIHVGRDATQETAKLEDGDRADVDPFCRCGREQLAESKHEACLCQEICTSDFVNILPSSWMKTQANAQALATHVT